MRSSSPPLLQHLAATRGGGVLSTNCSKLDWSQWRWYYKVVIFIRYACVWWLHTYITEEQVLVKGVEAEWCPWNVSAAVREEGRALCLGKLWFEDISPRLLIPLCFRTPLTLTDTETHYKVSPCSSPLILARYKTISGREEEKIGQG